MIYRQCWKLISYRACIVTYREILKLYENIFCYSLQCRKKLNADFIVLCVSPTIDSRLQMLLPYNTKQPWSYLYSTYNNTLLQSTNCDEYLIHHLLTRRKCIVIQQDKSQNHLPWLALIDLWFTLNFLPYLSKSFKNLLPLCFIVVHIILKVRTLPVLNLVSKWSWATLAKTLLLAKFTNLAKTASLLVISTTGPIAVLVVATLVEAAGLFLHGVWRVPWARRMPTSLLKNKPNVSCPENKVQEAKDLKGKENKLLSRWCDFNI